MAPYSSTLAWKTPWMEEPGGLQFMGSLSRTRLSNFTFTFHFHALEKEMVTHSSVLAWRIPGTGEPGGLPSMRSHRVGHDWSDLAVAAGRGRNARSVCAQRKCHMRPQQERSHLQDGKEARPLQKPTLSAPWSWTSVSGTVRKWISVV